MVLETTYTQELWFHLQCHFRQLYTITMVSFAMPFSSVVHMYKELSNEMSLLLKIADVEYGQCTWDLSTNHQSFIFLLVERIHKKGIKENLKG